MLLENLEAIGIIHDLQQPTTGFQLRCTTENLEAEDTELQLINRQEGTGVQLLPLPYGPSGASRHPELEETAENHDRGPRLQAPQPLQLQLVSEPQLMLTSSSPSSLSASHLMLL